MVLVAISRDNPRDLGTHYAEQYFSHRLEANNVKKKCAHWLNCTLSEPVRSLELLA